MTNLIVSYLNRPQALVGILVSIFIVFSSCSQIAVVSAIHHNEAGLVRQSTAIATGIINDLEMLMVTGASSNPSYREQAISKAADSQNVKSLRVVRADQVSRQFGPGTATEHYRDADDVQAIISRRPSYIRDADNHTLRAVIPYLVTSKCVSCHRVDIGTANGAANIVLDTTEEDDVAFQLQLIAVACDLIVAILLVAVYAWNTAFTQASTNVNYDSLTGLPNRRLFSDRISQSKLRSLRDTEDSAVMFVDLDDFKAINDTHGHAAGDEVLKKIASRLTDCVRRVDTVARLGGDEFAILLSGISSHTDVIAIAEKVIKVTGEPISWSEYDCCVSASVGITFLEKNDTEDTVLTRADKAMYSAKKSGKGKYSIL